MRRLATAAAVAALAASAGPAAGEAAHTTQTTANHRLGVPALHVGSRGPDVAALQWLLSGHAPYAFSKVKPTLRDYTAGISGGATSRTWRAERAMKFRLGYPGIGQCTSTVPHMHWNVNSAGPFFFALLLGHKQRPACWVALSARRIAAALNGASSNALKLKRYELSQVGTAEPYSEKYARYFGLSIWSQWCAILQGYSMRHIVPPLALLAPSNPWYVPNIITWGRYHGYLRATAKVGEFVLYYGDISHIGYVIAVNTSSGSYVTVEGNWANRVAIVPHSPYDHLHYFLADPPLAH